MSIEVDRELLGKVLGSRKSVKNNPKHIFGYSKIVDSCDFSVYERAFKADKIVAAYGTIIVKQHNNREIIYLPDARAPLFKYHLKLNKRTFPGLQNNSIISQCILIPYLRVVKKDMYVKDVRLCVITNHGQIYHNKPNRDINVEGFSKRNDVSKFEESVVWDIPGRKYPTMSESPKDYECYYPGLPSECYKYSPISNESSAFVDKYGSGGFPSFKVVFNGKKEEKCSRFYKYATSDRSNPFFHIGSGNRNDKMCLIGTYRANVDCGTRICIFASSDGGREWFCKYEFSDAGEYLFQQGYSNLWGTNFGHKISLDFDVDCKNDNYLVYKRNLVLPDKCDAKTSVEFDWELKATITRISSKEGTVIETEGPHGLSTGNIIAIRGKKDFSKPFGWLANEQLDKDGHSNFVQFKVCVLDDHKFEIYELLSSQFPTLPCRHIHHINTLKDGWIVGTGEIYPNSWLLYIQQKKADTYSTVSASDYLQISRINTGLHSVQRTMGLILNDSFNNSIIFASDHDTLDRDKINSPVLGNVSRGSTGVFVGELKDIDNMNKFECVFDTNEPCYYFQQLQDMLVFAGQRGELGICIDPAYKKWNKTRLNRFIMHYMGYFFNYHIFNDYIIYRK